MMIWRLVAFGGVRAAILSRVGVMSRTGFTYRRELVLRTDVNGFYVPTLNWFYARQYEDASGDRDSCRLRGVLEHVCAPFTVLSDMELVGVRLHTCRSMGSDPRSSQV